MIIGIQRQKPHNLLCKNFTHPIYGRDMKNGYVDLLETYCYFKGLHIHRRLRFDIQGKVYRVVRSGNRVVVFRTISKDIEDSEELLEILNDERLRDVTHLDINYDVNKNKLLKSSNLQQVYIIKTSDFDSRSVWDYIDR